MRTLSAGLIICALGVTSTASARMNFAGLAWGINSDAAKAVMTQRGYKFEKSEMDSGAVDFYFSGNVSNTPSSIILLFTPVGALASVTIITRKVANPMRLFNMTASNLVAKYGWAMRKREERSPAYDGVTSVAKLSQGILAGEVYMQSEWAGEDDTGVSLETFDRGALRIAYFGPNWNTEYYRREFVEPTDL